MRGSAENYFLNFYNSASSNGEVGDNTGGVKVAINVAFMASDAVALPVLDAMLAIHDLRLSGVVTQPDRASGRGQHMHRNIVATWADTHGITCLTPEKPDASTITWLQQNDVRLVFVLAYGHILSRELLAQPPLGVYNFHGSILPSYRGASPIAAAIANGDTVTGVSLMQMIYKMDAGPVVDVEKVAILPDDTEQSLRRRISEACVPLLHKHWPAIRDAQVNAVAQDEDAVTFTRMITKEDAKLDFRVPAQILQCRVRALTPWPGAVITYGGVDLKLGVVEVGTSCEGVLSGTLVQVGADGIHVATSERTLLIRSLQRPGGKMLSCREFLNGFELEVGAVVPSFSMKPLVSKTRTFS